MLSALLIHQEQAATVLRSRLTTFDRLDADGHREVLVPYRITLRQITDSGMPITDAAAWISAASPALDIPAADLISAFNRRPLDSLARAVFEHNRTGSRITREKACDGVRVSAPQLMRKGVEIKAPTARSKFSKLRHPVAQRDRHVEELVARTRSQEDRSDFLTAKPADSVDPNLRTPL